MRDKAIFFDLDGTLTDSGEGIINCAAVALEHFGLPVPDRDSMRFIVGPPLRGSLITLGVPEDRVEEAMTVFRARYNAIGIFENKPYPGISELLPELKRRGRRIFLATSKPENMALRVLEHFHWLEYFDAVCGATLDGLIETKSQVIACLLQKIGPQEQAVMVGDTQFDVSGAAEFGIPAIGVSWGYGTQQAMREAGAVAIAHTTQELLALL